MRPELHHFKQPLDRLWSGTIPILDFPVQEGELTDLVAGRQPFV